MKSLAIALTLAAWAFGVVAEEWVSVGTAPAVANSSTPAQPAPPPVQPVPANHDDNALMTELLLQVEQMQAEVSLLRGIVESQAYEIKRLNQESEARYLDIDRRLAAVMTAPVAEPQQEPVASGQDAYNAAMTLVREKKFDQASDAFDDFVATWPEDNLVANALYWSGEVYLVRREPAKAAERFKAVIDGYPEHVKTADATYKYAMTLHKMGDSQSASQWLESLISQYRGKADTTVALAEAYLKKLPVTSEEK